MKYPLLTILTPTFNRGHLLSKCYESLLKQSNNNFEWLIVDDGSTDDTEAIVTSLIDKKEINIRFLKKTNGGKHTAVNFGVREISSLLTLILDSDDYLAIDAVEVIEKTFNRFKGNSSICGFTFLKQYPDGRIMGDRFPQEGIYNFIDLRVNYKVSGDQCDVFFTNILKRFPFSEYAGEKFIGESTSWIRMANEYDMVGINHPIYIAEYLDGGLTKLGKRFRLNAPYGGMEYSNLCMQKRCCFKRRIHSSILYSVYALSAKISFVDYINCSKAKLLTVIMFPGGLYFYIKWKYFD